jgi:dTDP-glucose 4,6-dehydratase
MFLIKILVTGGAGFIGSNFLNKYIPLNPDKQFLNVDCLTYAGDLNYLHISNLPNYWFSKTDICDKEKLKIVFELFQPDCVIHIAAASHVDRSLDTPRDSFETNTIGTLNLLECCRDNWKEMKDKLFYFMSTDEIYGDGENFTEETPYQPNTPYAASKAAAGHIVRVYNKTYGIPTKTTCCSNNYGPNQHPEKFFSKMLHRMMNNQTLTIHGDGRHTREWLYVEDHCDGVWDVLTKGKDGEVYNIGSDKILTLIETISLIIKYAAKYLKVSEQSLSNRIEFIGDRIANDKNYSTNSNKIRKELGWFPKIDIEEGFERTVRHYIDFYRRQR